MLPSSPSLDRIAQGDLCAGCGACAGLLPDKVRMQVVKPGFLRPAQRAPLSPTEDAMIAAVCPGLGQTVHAQGRTDPVLWGPYMEMQTGWATSADFRFAGSSGGALSAVLGYLLAADIVDAVVQTAADPSFAIGNATVISANIADITAAAGSRYAPSAPLEKLDELRKQGKRFAFVGKPCDVAALRAICATDATVAAAFPVVLSFFCAGVPSHTGGQAVLAALGLTAPQTTSFRYRGNGWPGRAVAVAQDGSEASMTYHQSWGGILSKHVQHRCKICADGTGTAADIVCADAWESDTKGYPLFEEAPGISLIVARTKLGMDVIAAARKAGHLETQTFDVAKLPAIQPGQRERRRALFARLLALRLLRRPVPEYHGLQIGAAARQNSLGRNLRNFLGTLRRTLRRH